MEDKCIRNYREEDIDTISKRALERELLYIDGFIQSVNKMPLKFTEGVKRIDTYTIRKDICAFVPKNTTIELLEEAEFDELLGIIKDYCFMTTIQFGEDEVVYLDIPKGYEKMLKKRTDLLEDEIKYRNSLKYKIGTRKIFEYLKENLYWIAPLVVSIVLVIYSTNLYSRSIENMEPCFFNDPNNVINLINSLKK